MSVWILQREKLRLIVCWLRLFGGVHFKHVVRLCESFRLIFIRLFAFITLGISATTNFGDVECTSVMLLDKLHAPRPRRLRFQHSPPQKKTI